MDCGDAGHILLSSAVVELLGQVGAWPIHDLGEFQTKHGTRLHLFSLYSDQIGNPSLPSKLREARATGSPATAAAPAAIAVAGGERPSRVALLYKRNREPDETLMRFLETELAVQGYSVFVDRNLLPGLEWAHEIERQLRRADAVIPLLSSAAAQSELLAYELQIAHDAAQEQRGRPRLLPVRVRFPGPLPDAIAGILDPVHQIVWEHPEENTRLVEELLRALETPATTAPAVPRGRWEPVGGAVPLDSLFYVERPSDREFHAAIARRDSIVLVKGARQMGKTSLLARGLQQARDAGARVLLTDFQELNAAHLTSVESFCLALAEWIGDQLDLDVSPEEVWKSGRGASVNLERYLRREALGKIAARVLTSRISGWKTRWGCGRRRWLPALRRTGAWLWAT